MDLSHIYLIFINIYILHLSMETHPYPPYNAEKCSILFLGSFPPKATYQRDGEPLPSFYYQSTRNQFWKIIDLIFGTDLYLSSLEDPVALQKNVSDKKEFLLKNSLGMADIIYRCERKKASASDADIGVLEFLDINRLVASNRNLKTILCTSSFVYRLCCRELSYEVDVGKLPSPSPRYIMSLDKKTGHYKDVISRYLYIS